MILLGIEVQRLYIWVHTPLVCWSPSHNEVELRSTEARLGCVLVILQRPRAQQFLLKAIFNLQDHKCTLTLLEVFFHLFNMVLKD